MKITVKVKTGAKENVLQKIESAQMSLGFTESKGSEKSARTNENFYEARVKELPVHGRANDAVTRLVADHFDVTLSYVRLISGATSKKKIFEILENV